MLTRRSFLKSSSLLALAPTVPLFIARTAKALTAERDTRVLVIVQLDGGNDALNTVVPLSDSDYEKLRPKLKLNRNQLIRLNDAVGLHPSLQRLDKLWQAGHLAVVPGVGYPNPNRSHFESMAIWHTARFDAEEFKSYGWLGRALDPSAGSAYSIGTGVPSALRGRRSTAVSLGDINDMVLVDPPVKQLISATPSEDLLSFVREQTINAYAAADKLSGLAMASTNNEYPPTEFGARLKLVAKLLKADLGARVFYTIQPGYDMHANQLFTHANLLSEFAGAVAAFFDDLMSAKLAERVALLAFSEFGRTIKENGSAGTDHGTAGVVFIAGPSVRSGLVGSMPSLTDLVAGEPKMTTDFRQIYAATLGDWLRLSSEVALGGAFERLALFKAM